MNMKLSLYRLLACVATTATSLQAVERLPIEDFAREPAVAGARLSPDGKYFAYLGEYLGVKRLHVGEVANNNVVRLDIHGAGLVNDAPKEVSTYDWVSDKRLVVTTTVWDMLYGVLAVDRDGAHEVSLGGYEGDQMDLRAGGRLFPREIIHRFYDKDENVLMLDRHIDMDSVGGANRPDVLMVHTSEGLISTLVKNPGEVGAWRADSNGVVRFGVLSHGDLSGAIYRENEQAPWRTILPLKNRQGTMWPVGFDAANERVFVAALTEKKRWTVFPLDPATGARGAALLEDDEYDIMPDHFIPGIDGHALCAAIFSKRGDTLLGLRYVTETLRVKWYDPAMAKTQKAVDRALPNTTNFMVDTSLDGKQTLWLAFSDQNPGVYFLADAEKHTFKQLAPRMSWIKPAQMASMLAVKYAARDGLTIHGFLTVPVGHAPKNLPLVVMPHGGPWVRDVWGFDPLVQLLANRGYAVLQMNYRGSPGYGEELYRQAKRQIGGKIQDDIEDGTRWAIAAGVADPKRIAIIGASYGGYSALFALGHNPDLYRCGISQAGVTDWTAFLGNSDVADYKEATRYWHEQLGDPEKDKDLLRAASPVNFADKITAPVLIIQGKEDRRVPPDQARRMISALEKSGHKPESMFLSGVGHTFGREKDRIEIFKRIAAFLEKQLGPGVE
jgi:dipeptidyl aminopeptidase/acylaminoacyl peptidase